MTFLYIYYDKIILIMLVINFGLLDFKKNNTWFTLKFQAYQKAFQTHYSFGKLENYKNLYCIKYYETQN